jgi:hypothetical protein
LVFVPIDPTTGFVFTGHLRGFVNGRSLHTLEAYPSRAWPKNVGQAFEEGRPMNSLLFDYIDYLSAMVATSAGAVSITPDYIGYGESVEYNRTFLSKIPYEQAIAIAWLGTKQYVQDELDACSFLENTATVTGKLLASLVVCLHLLYRYYYTEYYSISILYSIMFYSIL